MWVALRLAGCPIAETTKVLIFAALEKSLWNAGEGRGQASVASLEGIIDLCIFPVFALLNDISSISSLSNAPKRILIGAGAN